MSPHKVNLKEKMFERVNKHKTSSLNKSFGLLHQKTCTNACTISYQNSRSFNVTQISRSLSSEKLTDAKQEILKCWMKLKEGSNHKTNDVFDLTLRGYEISKRSRNKSYLMNSMVLDDINNSLGPYRKSDSRSTFSMVA